MTVTDDEHDTAPDVGAPPKPAAAAAVGPRRPLRAGEGRRDAPPQPHLARRRRPARGAQRARWRAAVHVQRRPDRRARRRRRAAARPPGRTRRPPDRARRRRRRRDVDVAGRCRRRDRSVPDRACPRRHDADAGHVRRRGPPRRPTRWCSAPPSTRARRHCRASRSVRRSSCWRSPHADPADAGCRRRGGARSGSGTVWAVESIATGQLWVSLRVPRDVGVRGIAGLGGGHPACRADRWHRMTLARRRLRRRVTGRHQPGDRSRRGVAGSRSPACRRRGRSRRRPSRCRARRRCRARPDGARPRRADGDRPDGGRSRRARRRGRRRLVRDPGAGIAGAGALGARPRRRLARPR